MQQDTRGDRMREDKLMEVLREDYKEMCDEVGVEYNKDKFDEYLDKLFQSMCDIFMEVNNK